ncbi:SIS domain-containing protein [Candidatus Parcubacteria bacterium]|nr:MAG: SIS domain-containing protein [Candidatus Parcubacteria bacterium]
MITPAEYLKSVCDAALQIDQMAVKAAIDVLEEAYRNGRGVFVIGNGGSAANASHFAQDLSKGAIPDLDGKRFRVMSLTDNVSFITAIANDISYERVFDIQLKQFAREGDLLFAVSGSGYSANIIRAAECARQLKMKVIGVTGFDGGKLIQLSDIKLHVPCNDMCKSEAVHGIMFHMMTDILKARLLSI